MILRTLRTYLIVNRKRTVWISNNRIGSLITNKMINNNNSSNSSNNLTMVNLRSQVVAVLHKILGKKNHLAVEEVEQTGVVRLAQVLFKIHHPHNLSSSSSTIMLFRKRNS